MSPVAERTLYAKTTDFSENKFGEKLSESFEILLNNEAARTHINSILEQLKCPLTIRLPKNSVLTIEEIRMNGGEAAIYLSSLRHLVFANGTSFRKYKISLIKRISIGQYRQEHY